MSQLEEGKVRPIPRSLAPLAGRVAEKWQDSIHQGLRGGTDDLSVLNPQFSRGEISYPVSRYLRFSRLRIVIPAGASHSRRE